MKLVLTAKHKINVGQSTHIFTEAYYWQRPIKNAYSSGGCGIEVKYRQ